MFLKAVIHDAEEGGYWAEVASLPCCMTEDDTVDDLFANLKEAVRGRLAALNDRGGASDRVRQVVDIEVRKLAPVESSSVPRRTEGGR